MEGAQASERLAESSGNAGLLSGYGAVQAAVTSTSGSFSGRAVEGSVQEGQTEVPDVVVEGPVVGQTDMPQATSGMSTEAPPSGAAADSGSSSGRDVFYSAGRTTPQDTAQVAQMIQVQGQPQLFGPEANFRLAQLEREAPHLYGGGIPMTSGAARSDSSGFSAGEIQAEVHRQLELVRREHALQMRALAAENEALRNRSLLFEGRRPVQVESSGAGWGNQASGDAQVLLQGTGLSPDAAGILAGLQALVSQQNGSSSPTEGKAEQVKHSWSELPKLPELGPESSLAFSDWLHLVAPLVEDMSATSAQYWALLTREAEEVYRRYLASDPMGRISLNPVETPELKSPVWSRLAKRLEALLITAAPKQVREELVQSRLKSPLHLLYRLHVLYAPGGVQEREHALRSLQHTSSATTPQAALDALRQWRRWLSRTEALGGSLPDPVILIKALLNIVKTVLEGNAEVQFRMGLVKAALRAETAPTVAVVHQLHAALLSEVEGLARTQTLKPKATPSAAAVNEKALGSQSPLEAGQQPKAAAVAAQVATAQDANSSQVQALLDDAAKVLKAIQAPGSQVRDPPVAPRAEAATPKAAPVLQGTPVTVATLQSHLDAIRQAIPEVQQTSEKPSIKAIASLAMPLEEEGPLEEADPDEQVGLLDSGATHAVRAREERDQDLTATEVVLARALELIQQLEERRLEKLRGQVDETEAVLRALTSKVPLVKAVDRAKEEGTRADVMQTALSCGVFEHHHLQSIATTIPREERELRHTLKGLSLPRRRRRALEQSKDWFVNLQFGKEPAAVSENVLSACPDAQVLHIDLSKPHNNLEPGSPLRASLAWAALHGRIIGLSADLASRSELLVQVSWLWAVASAGRGYTVPLMTLSHSAKLFKDEWWPKFQRWAHLKQASAIRGAVTVFTNCRTDLVETCENRSVLPERVVQSFQPQRPQPVSEEELRRIDQEVRESLRLIRPSIASGGQVPEAQGVKQAVPTAAALDVEGWRRHIESGHLPFNRKCKACVMGSGVGLQHRKVAHPTSFSLSLDVLGPIQKGIFEDSVAAQPRHKYALVGAYRVPEDVLRRRWDPKKDLKDLFRDTTLELASANEYLGGELKGAEPEPAPSDPLLPIQEGQEEEMREEEWDQSERGPEESLVSVELEAESHSGETLQQAIETLKDPVPQVVLRFVRPMTSRKGPSLMPAIHSMVQEINKLGFPVKNVHSDQGREFLSDSLRLWLSKMGVRVTMSEAHDKKANGLAERIVGWCKQRARCLLNSAELEPSFWPYAMSHATASHQASLIGDTPLPHFGKRIVFKRPMLPGNFKPWDHWSEGRYLSPSILVPGGHSILRPDGNTTVVKNFRDDLVDPEALVRQRDEELKEAAEVAADASLSEGGQEELFPELFGPDGREPTGSLKEVIGAGVGVIDPGPADSELPPPSRLKGKGPRLRPRPRLAALREQEPEEEEDEESEEESEEPDEVTDVEANTISEGQISSLGSSSSSGQQFPRSLGSIQDPVIIRALVRLSLESRAQGLYDLGVHEVGDLNYVFRTDLVEEGWTDHEATVFLHECGLIAPAQRSENPRSAGYVEGQVGLIGREDEFPRTMGAKARARREARERAEALRVQPRAPGSDAGATAGSTEPPEPRHNPRITRPILDQLPARFYDEVIANQPISRDLLSRVEEEAHDADLTMEPNDEEYAQNVFQTTRSRMSCNPNGVTPVVGRLMLRKFARFRKDSFGLLPPEQEPALEAASEELASALLELGPGISTQGVEQMVRRLPYETPHPALAGDQTSGEGGRAFYCGAMCRGGISSLRRSCAENPLAIKCLTRLLRRAFPHMCFSSAAVLEEVMAPPHRDSRNEATPNLILPLTRFEGGAVWEENEFGNVLRDVKGKPTAGRLLDVATGPQTLQAHSKFHLTEPWAGRRVILVGYTVSRIEFLSEDQRGKLRELGFVLPGDITAGEEGEPALRVNRPEIRKVEAIPLAREPDTWRGQYEFTLVSEETFRGYLRGNRGREDWERATQGEFFRGGHVIDEATQTMFRANETHERLAVAAVTSGVIQSGIHNGDMILREYLGDPRDHGPSEPEEPVPVVELLGQVRDLYADSRSPQEYHIGFRLKRTTEDVDREGNYLGDQFFFVRCLMRASQTPQTVADVEMMSRVLRRGDRRHRASYEGAGGAYYFSSIPLLHGSESNQGRRGPATGSTQSSSSRGPHPYVRALSPTTASPSRSEGTGSSDEMRPSGEPSSSPASPTIPVYRLDPAVLIPSSLLLPASVAPQSECRPSLGRQGHEDPEVNKIEVYTKDVEAKLEALGDSSLETTYTVSPAEARKHAERWRAALLEELRCLEEKGAIIRRKGAEAQKLLSDPEAVTLHSKGVYTVKPGKYRPDGPKQAFRRKARIVACGNESRYTDTGDVYAAGVAGDVLRAALLKGASRRWKAFGTDVHTAFLLAPLGTTRRYLLQPPAILKALNLISDGEIWEINRALYGLRESPRWWTDYRNAALTGLTFQLRNAETGNLEPYRLEQGSTEGNVFKIRGPNGELEGLLVCYVDDFLILSSDPVAKALYEAMCTQLNWELDPLQEATRQNPLKFLGVGISPLENEPGFALDQRSYIDELLAKNGFQGRGSNIPCPKELLSDGDLEDPEDVSYPTSLREAQRLTGELLWLAQKSRPDVSFVVQYMASHTIGRPRHVCDVAQRVFRYLSLTRDRHLRLVPEAEKGLEVFTDASFAPTGKHSQGGILIKYMGSTIQWKASKLPLIAISSAEAELQALSEGAIYGQSLQAVLRDITDEPPSLALLCDSTSAIALAEGGSSQRTRHLQVRAAALTQQLGSSMTLEHCPGDVQCADLLTKPLAGPRLHELSLLVGLSDEAEPPSVGKVEVLSGCGGALSKWLTALTAFAQVMPGSGQGEEEEDFQGVTSDLSLYVALVVVIIAIVGLWEGIKVVSRSCRGPPSPSIRALRKKDRLEKAVREALDKEVTSSTPSSSDQPIKRRGRPTSQPPSAQGHSTATSSTTTTTLLQVSRFSQTEVLDGGRITRRSQGVQTDPDAQHQVLMPPTGVNPGAVMTTMQRGGVVHLFNDCGTLGTPGYRQERTFCRQCLARANLRP
ncbi:RE1 [Symbiodinium sp. CCMP2592]|nr:RE1 [Symbiodinium sp. CCMP2592]